MAPSRWTLYLSFSAVGNAVELQTNRVESTGLKRQPPCPETLQETLPARRWPPSACAVVKGWCPDVGNWLSRFSCSSGSSAWGFPGWAGRNSTGLWLDTWEGTVGSRRARRFPSGFWLRADYWPWHPPSLGPCQGRSEPDQAHSKGADRRGVRVLYGSFIYKVKRGSGRVSPAAWFRRGRWGGSLHSARPLMLQVIQGIAPALCPASRLS